MSALDLLATRVPGHALPRPFYTDAEIHRLDLQTIWYRGFVRLMAPVVAGPLGASDYAASSAASRHMAKAPARN